MDAFWQTALGAFVGGAVVFFLGYSHDRHVEKKRRLATLLKTQKALAEYWGHLRQYRTDALEDARNKSSQTPETPWQVNVTRFIGGTEMRVPLEELDFLITQSPTDSNLLIKVEDAERSYMIFRAVVDEVHQRIEALSEVSDTSMNAEDALTGTKPLKTEIASKHTHLLRLKVATVDRLDENIERYITNTKTAFDLISEYLWKNFNSRGFTLRASDNTVQSEMTPRELYSSKYP